MNYTVSQKEENLYEIKITLSAEEWNEANVRAYEKNKHKYSFGGFRKGHVPRRVLLNAYGEGLFYEEAFQDSFPRYYGEVLEKETQIVPVDVPDVDVESISEEGITYVALVPTKPVVVVETYKGIEVEKKAVRVTEKEIEEEIEKDRERVARMISVSDRPAQNGDTVIIDYSGSVDGVKFDGGTAEKQSLELGSGRFIPGFEEQVVGMAIGEERDINVTFPAEYGEKSLAGKAAVFAIKLHEIQVKEIPALDDEFVKDVSEFDTVKEYKADVKARLKQKKEKQAETEWENALVQKICDGVTVSIPKAMIEAQIDEMVQEFSYRLMYQGLKLNDYLGYIGQTMEQFRESYTEPAERQVKTRLVFEALIKQEGLACTDEEFDAKVKEQAESVQKDFEEYKKGMPERQVEYIRNEIVIDKLFDMLRTYNPPKAKAKKDTAAE